MTTGMRESPLAVVTGLTARYPCRCCEDRHSIPSVGNKRRGERDEIIEQLKRTCIWRCKLYSSQSIVEIVTL